jgi:uncharacterized protein (DUF486 family)
MLTIALLFISNVFMTFAWYGHLKYKGVPLWQATLVSWLLAALEYMFQVPANRWGSATFSVGQLKTIQVIIELAVFTGFVRLYMKQAITWNYVVGFFFLFVGAFFVFRKF